MSTDWTAIEDALYAWVSGASGVTTLWAAQNAPRPVNGAAWISMRIMSVDRVAQDWNYITDAAAPVDGAELIATVQGTRAVTLSLQCFATTPFGAAGAAQILDKVIASARLPSHSDALNAAGIGVRGFGAVTSVDGFQNVVDFEPRAVVDCNLIVPVEYGSDTDTLTYIQSTDLVGVLPVGDDETPVDHVIVRLVERD